MQHRDQAIEQVGVLDQRREALGVHEHRHRADVVDQPPEQRDLSPQVRRARGEGVG